MVKKYRKAFNDNFSAAKYQDLLTSVDHSYPKIPFRVAESPLFIPQQLKAKLIAAGEEIIQLIKQPNFKALTESSIPTAWKVPNENDHPHFLSFDFGLCKDEAGEISPMLIEMQGFPSLYGFQSHLADIYKDSYNLESSLTPFFNELTTNQYYELLEKVIVGNFDPREVVLMDVDAHNQPTVIDFLITANKIGVKILALAEVKQEDNRLYYECAGEKVFIKRIYNRLIFDEVANDSTAFQHSFDPRTALDVEWITHPNWFYRISKFTMPLLSGRFVPHTQFLDKIAQLPADLEHYVLKPLFSFAGRGVIIDVKVSDIDTIADPENWILQRKVLYEPVLQSPTGGVKAEIRLMYIWPDGEEPKLCINLTRLSKGKMIGVRHNANFDWVGGSVGLME